jgi:hypothetical protein
MQQLGLFDTLRTPPVRVRVEPHGDVLSAELEPDFTFTLPHPRMAWHRAEIEIHRHANGLWMWSISSMADMSGGGYRVGPKWGKFAETREDALFYACEEMLQRLGEKITSDVHLIRNWVLALRDDARAFR